jgi:chromosome segregation ATPase
MNRAGDDDLLRETRKLLNALNEENSELKRQNDAVAEQARSAQDVIAQLRQDKENLERDLKQINLNLMQQLRAKVAHTKELEQRLEEASRVAVSGSTASARAAAEREELQHLRGDLEAQLKASQAELSEHRRAAADTEKSLQGQLHDARQQLLRQADEAAAARRESAQIIATLQHDVAVARQQLLEKEAALLTHDEEARVMMEHSALERMAADMRRLQTAESDAAFAHEQLHSISAFVARHLSDVQQRLRGLVTSCDEHGEELAAALGGIKEQQTALGEVVATDGAVIHYLQQRLSELEQKLSATEKELATERDRSAALHANLSEGAAEGRGLAAELQDCRRHVERLTEREAAAAKSHAELQSQLAARVAEAELSSRQTQRLESAVAELQATIAAQSAQQHAADIQAQKDRSKHAVLLARRDSQVTALEQTLAAERRDREEEQLLLVGEANRLQGLLDGCAAALAAGLDKCTGPASAPHPAVAERLSRSRSQQQAVYVQHHDSPAVLRPSGGSQQSVGSARLHRSAPSYGGTRPSIEGSRWDGDESKDMSPHDGREGSLPPDAALVSQMLQAAKGVDGADGTS